MEQESVLIDGETYTLVKTRAHTPVSVFKGKDSFLRLGPKEILEPELSFHKNLLLYGFPIAKIVKEGSFNDKFYYAEEPLGDKLLGDLFWEDCKQNSQISDNNFKDNLNISVQFAEAQFRSIILNQNQESFYLGLHMDKIHEELPHLKEKIDRAFKKVLGNIKDLPFVFTHGDFNTFNIFKNGVIDLGDSFEAPIGYDLVTNICHTYFFPEPGDYETMRRYDYTKAQIDEYIDAIDAVFVSNGLPKLSNFIDDFTFCRAVWMTVNIQRFPKLQKWRYAQFTEILSGYLESQPIFKKLIDLRVN